MRPVKGSSAVASVVPASADAFTTGLKLPIVQVRVAARTGEIGGPAEFGQLHIRADRTAIDPHGLAIAQADAIDIADIVVGGDRVDARIHHVAREEGVGAGLSRPMRRPAP